MPDGHWLNQEAAKNVHSENHIRSSRLGVLVLDHQLKHIYIYTNVKHPAGGGVLWNQTMQKKLELSIGVMPDAILAMSEE